MKFQFKPQRLSTCRIIEKSLGILFAFNPISPVIRVIEVQTKVKNHLRSPAPGVFSFALSLCHLVILSLLMSVPAFAEPVVLIGRDLPAFIGVPVGNLRIVNARGVAIPFQIDEKTAGGDYIANGGVESNADSAHPGLQSQDEIVFLNEDADSSASRAGGFAPGELKRAAPITLTGGSGTKTVYLLNDSTVPLSPVRYVSYDEKTEYVKTPWYYAQFGRNRFHFIRAGIGEGLGDRYFDLTNRLRIEIVLKTLWGILPIRYNEDNIVCTVKRYKVGPVRLIRRGDFYLRLGLFGLKGSRAVVYQTCYPQAVEVPIHVHLPVRLGSLFREAYIEMSPVVNTNARGFAFAIPSLGTSFACSSPGRIDTFIRTIPDQGFMVSNGLIGFAWVTRFGVSEDHLQGSGYLFHRPSKQGLAECGLRYVVRDLPKGDYAVANWVLFPRPCIAPPSGAILDLIKPATVDVSGKKAVDLFMAPFAGWPPPGRI